MLTVALPLPGGRITGLQWSGKNDVVAIGHVDSSENTSVIQLLEPSNPQDLTQLQLPISGPDNALKHLEWAGSSCRRALLTLSQQGTLHIWDQHDATSPSRAEPCCVDTWHPHAVTPAPPSPPVVARFVSLPHVHTFSTPHLNSCLDVSQLDIESILPKPTPVGGSHWVRPGALVIAAADSHANLSFLWEDSLQETPGWRCTPPLTLEMPIHGLADQSSGLAPIAFAVSIAETSSIRVALACKAHGHIIRVKTVAGNPVFGVSSRVDAAVSYRLPESHRVLQLEFAAAGEGSLLLCLSAAAPAAGSSVTSYSVTRLQIGPQGFSMQPSATFEFSSSSTSTTSSSSMAISPDGELVAVAAGTSQMVLHTINLQPCQQQGPAAGSTPAAVCFSPNTACLCSISTQPAQPAAAAAPSAPSTLLHISALDQDSIHPPASSTPAQQQEQQEQQEVRNRRLAARLALCLLTSSQPWDLAFSITQAGEADGHGSTSAVLRLLDCLYHSSQPHLKSSLQQGMDRVKLAVLQHVPGKAAEVQVMDLRASLLLQGLQQQMQRLYQAVFAAVRNHLDLQNSGAKGGNVGKVHMEEARRLMSSAEPSCEWLKAFMHFTLCCTRAWLERSTAAAAALAAAAAAGDQEAAARAAAARAEADVVPWVALLPGLYHYLVVQELLRHFSRVKSSQSNFSLVLLAARLQPPSLLHPGKACNLDSDETLALVNASRALLAPITAQGQTHADMARLAHEAYGSYSRPFRMHYARAQGAVVTPTQELLQKFDEKTDSRFPKAVTDEQLWQQARDLGLLPPSKQQAAPQAAPRAAVQQLHASFRAAAPPAAPNLLQDQEAQQVLLGAQVSQLVGPATPPQPGEQASSAAEQAEQQLQKLRQRWQRARQAAMGLAQQQGSSAGGSRHGFDVLDLGGARNEAGLSFVAVDGSCATDLLHKPDLHPVVTGKRAWVCASPLTASAWKKARVT